MWYWQERLHRDLAVAATLESPARLQAEGNGEEFLKQHRQDRASRSEAVRRAVGSELAELPAGVEVKMRLLDLNRYSSGLGSELDYPLMGRCECRRVSSERLLEPLERKNLWEDVDWDRVAYTILVVQVAGQAEQFFPRKGVGTDPFAAEN